MTLAEEASKDDDASRPLSEREIVRGEGLKKT